jgi:antitoxin ParD1/3/4
MELKLSPEVEDLLRQKLRTGRYSSENELMHEALRLLDEQDRFLDLRREEFGSAIAEGLNSLARGEGVDGEQVFDRLELELDSIERDRAT